MLSYGNKKFECLFIQVSPPTKRKHKPRNLVASNFRSGTGLCSLLGARWSTTGDPEISGTQRVSMQHSSARLWSLETWHVCCSRPSTVTFWDENLTVPQLTGVLQDKLSCVKHSHLSGGTPPQNANNNKKKFPRCRPYFFHALGQARFINVLYFILCLQASKALN